MNARFAQKRFKLSTAFLSIILIITMMLIAFGCGQDQPRQRAAYVPSAQPSMNWSYENGIAYYFTDPNTVIVRANGQQVSISRFNQRGDYGWISWAWEEDGDIDVRVQGIGSADLDSPFDYDGPRYATWDEPYEGYMEDPADEGFVWLWMGGKKHKKHKSWLKQNPKYNKAFAPTAAQKAKYDKLVAQNKALKAKSERQRAELKKQQAANAKKKRQLAKQQPRKKSPALASGIKSAKAYGNASYKPQKPKRQRYASSGGSKRRSGGKRK